MLVTKKNNQIESAEASLCIEEVISKLKIDLEMTSDPQMIEEIVQKEMFLDDCYGFQSRFSSKLKHPESLKPMLEKIRSGMIAHHPALVEFLCAALREDLISVGHKMQAYVKRTIHYIYLLDMLTEEMFDNWEFMVELRYHFLEKREQLGIDSDFIRSFVDIFKITGGLFFSAKTVTMDWVFKEYERIRRQGFIEKEDVIKRKTGLTLNILEAVITDKRKGFRNNALTGLALIVTPPKDVILTPEKRALEYLLSSQWTELYETWNLAFISGNMDNLDLLYPKLLIPSVLNASPHQYLFNRALSLWAAINFYLFRKASNQSDINLPNASRIAQLWGEINLKYAREYLRQNSPIELIGTRPPRMREQDHTVGESLVEINSNDLLLSRLNDMVDSQEPQVKKMIAELSSDLLKR
ncbi:MAG: hypothetical protein AB4063_05455 [Crocosphaera sp.]